MPVNERDLELIQQELRCLRRKFGNTLSTAGGSISGSVTAPSSSIYPNSYFEDCDCANLAVVGNDPVDICGAGSSVDTESLGDLADQAAYSNKLYKTAYLFDGAKGVFYSTPELGLYETRNAGLTDVRLEHGVVDPWWKRKTNGNASQEMIVWVCGNQFIKRSDNAGRVSYKALYPDSGVNHIQIIPDPFTINVWYVLGNNESGQYAYIHRTVDDGKNWDTLDITGYNGASSRQLIWGAIAGNGGSKLFVTTWNNVNGLDLLTINVGATGSMSTAGMISLGSATLEEVEEFDYIASPATSLRSENLIVVYGRMNDPQSLGLSHVIHTTDGGNNWSVVRNDWGTDYAGSVKVSNSEALVPSGGAYKYYGVRNIKDLPNAQTTAKYYYGTNNLDNEVDILNAN